MIITNSTTPLCHTEWIMLQVDVERKQHKLGFVILNEVKNLGSKLGTIPSANSNPGLRNI